MNKGVRIRTWWRDGEKLVCLLTTQITSRIGYGIQILLLIRSTSFSSWIAITCPPIFSLVLQYSNYLLPNTSGKGIYPASPHHRSMSTESCKLSHKKLRKAITYPLSKPFSTPPPKKRLRTDSGFIANTYFAVHSFQYNLLSTILCCFFFFSFSAKGDRLMLKPDAILIHLLVNTQPYNNLCTMLLSQIETRCLYSTEYV